MVTCKFAPGDTIDVHVDDQHLSRLSGKELRQIITQALLFGGPKLREDIAHWLAGGKLDELGNMLTEIEEPR